MQLLGWLGGPHCHGNACPLCPLLKEDTQSVFFTLCFCVCLGVFGCFFSVLLFLESLFEKFFGSELLFLGVGVGLVFFGGFCLCFCFMFWRVAPESVWKNSLDVRSAVFWVRSLFLRFFRRRRFPRGPKDQKNSRFRARLKISSESENFERATHRGPIFLWGNSRRRD